MARLKIAVLVSGRGSNLQALIDACADPAFPAEIALVLSNIEGVFALERAAKAGIPTAVVKHKDYPDRRSFEIEMDRVLRTSGAELLCLAGFMRVLTADFITAWADRIINIHPSLLPAFPGLHTHKRAIESGAKFAGCTVHFVSPEVDAGPIIIQAAIPIRPEDDEDSLAARVLAAEHKIFPAALALVAHDRVEIKGNRTIIKDAPTPEGTLISPEINKA
jgi:phosphoribosylglycinamide formyltransferase-1